MSFFPHTQKDIDFMLSVLGIDSLEQLFSEIPTSLRKDGLDAAIIPEAVNEMQAKREFAERAAQDKFELGFIGAGAYEHHIPAAVWELTSRGEFLTAYTPYQAEASQGTLQLIYEYQTMMASLMGLAISNASVYDGASALAEAIFMAIRAQNKIKSKKVLLPSTLHPAYRQVVRSIVGQQDIEVIEIPYCAKSGKILLTTLADYKNQDIAALVINQPNFFGILEDVDELTDWAHSQNALAIAVVNPLAMALLKEPGSWGKQGADIACGEGQSLGIPLASGGPYFGFLCCKQELIRQMPGRLVGRTVDRTGKPGFTLTLQAREQHIRRAKATSNICTNQGLLVTAATIYMSLLGQHGLHQVAAISHQNTVKLVELLTKIPGVQQVFNQPFFHEVVLKVDCNGHDLLSALANQGIHGGYSMVTHYPELGEAILVCATETKTIADLEHYQKTMTAILHSKSFAVSRNRDAVVVDSHK